MSGEILAPHSEAEQKPGGQERQSDDTKVPSLSFSGFVTFGNERSIKNSNLCEPRDLNSEAEKTKSFGEVISEDFQRRCLIIIS